MELKVMTYNIRHCRGLDNRVSVRRVANVIGEVNPDIVGINEADKFNIRSFFTNQPACLARLLGMNYFFGANLRLWFARYGNIILSKVKMQKARNTFLPSLFEKRGFARATLVYNGRIVNFISTHLGLTKRERAQQIDSLAREADNSTEPLILAGDFNCGCDELGPLLETMQLAGEKCTYPASRPEQSLDYILCSRHFTLQEVYTKNVLASDHLPLVARLRLLE